MLIVTEDKTISPALGVLLECSTRVDVGTAIVQFLTVSTAPLTLLFVLPANLVSSYPVMVLTANLVPVLYRLTVSSAL